MTLLLALDTATERASLAVGVPGGAIHERVVAGRRELSRDIERIAAALLAEAGATPGDLGGVVVADGPGSFTGLRIGIAFAKGLVRVLGVPLRTTPSLMAAAWAVRGARFAGRDRADESHAPHTTHRAPVVAEYDALRGEVYRAVYRFARSAIETLLPPTVVSAAEPRPPGALLATEAQASAAALIGLSELHGGLQVVGAVAAWEPSYGRPAEAEARRLARERA